MEKWTRPKSVPFPTVWKKYDGRKETEDGKIPQFSIEDVTEDMHEDIIAFLTEFHFHPTFGSTLMKYVKMYEDPASVKEYQHKWKKSLEDNISLVAFLDNEGQEGKRMIAGVNVLKIDYKNYPEDINKIQSKKIRTVAKTLNYAASQVNVYERYGVDKFVSALGLCIHPKFRGQGLGLEILKCRFDIMKALGLKCTMTVFSTGVTQRIATKAGMEVMVEVPYDHYKEEDGTPSFPGIDCAVLVPMVKIVE